MQPDDAHMTDLVDGLDTDPVWQSWLEAHPDVAADVARVQRLRGRLRELRAAEIAPPADFEARLFTLIRQDSALLDLLNLGIGGMGRTLIELLNALLALLPAAPPQQPLGASPRS